MEKKDIFESIRDVQKSLRKADRYIPQVEERSIDRAEIKEAVKLFRHVVFGNFFGALDLSTSLSRLYTILSHQIAYISKIFNKVMPCCAEETAQQFIESIPELRRLLGTDVKAIFDGDPAAVSHEEVILCYPSLVAMIHYRMAHRLLELGVPILPRVITELAHSLTGIDIHPGAQIGEYFSIDHGTGVVIGETAIIGNHVQLYQGVTLGAKSFKFDENGNPINIPRHPVIEDNVVIYSNTSVLGRVTIGHDTIIGGNVWLTQDLPPHSKFFQNREK
ncbi:MAG: serine acetyltransferase [Bacteroidaceae bacterium]|nr:serine acetyltransferase [Bacteroidaceae bacterium]